MAIAILSSMDQEIRAVESQLLQPVTRELSGRQFITGSLCGTDVVTAISGYGKTGAAATTGALLAAFAVDSVVFGGVAGGIHDTVSIGDVVVADRLIHHDIDVSPRFAPHGVPSLGRAEIPADPELTMHLADAAHEHFGADAVAATPQGKVHVGLVASGDQFISSEAQVAGLRRKLPEVLAVEMEGAAVAQVCAERQVPFAVFRSISDRADSDAAVDFAEFVDTVAAPLTAGVVTRLLQRLS